MPKSDIKKAVMKDNEGRERVVVELGGDAMVLPKKKRVRKSGDGTFTEDRVHPDLNGTRLVVRVEESVKDLVFPGKGLYPSEGEYVITIYRKK